MWKFLLTQWTPIKFWLLLFGGQLFSILVAATIATQKKNFFLFHGIYLSIYTFGTIMYIIWQYNKYKNKNIKKP